ncbi:MAG: FAD-dependent oxidoreductase [Gudongella sp.]|jgi:NADPH-dependent 2,4-dienoyl-CoA reductase/sulfur reductase-like enzyme|nr:FAD-dependent oxidoreductase [Gudongella sp.]
MEKIVLIGGGVATKGFLTAALDFYEGLDITVIRQYKRSPVPCGIPYSIGTLESSEDNISPDKNFEGQGVKFIFDVVTSVDKENKIVNMKGGENLPYDKLIFATGTVPFTPPIPGIDLENVVSVRKDVDYVCELKKKVDAAKNIVVIGGGFIGVELADEFTKLEGKNVSIVELARNCLSQAFDVEYCEAIESDLRESGITLYTSTGVSEFLGDGKVESVLLSTGEKIEADLVFLNIGARPLVSLADEMGLKLTERKSIAVDKFLRTSEKDVMAIGDCAQKRDFFNGNEGGPLLASVAAREGRMAAANLFEANYPLSPEGSVSVFATAVRDNYYSAAGITAEAAARYGYEYEVINVEASDKHPATLPGSRTVKGKFVFAKKSGELLGVQFSGNVQVAEMANMIGYAIQHKSTARDLFDNVYGTHPLSTSSPVHYIIHVAAQKMMANFFK